jgi:hypothetical protein
MFTPGAMASVTGDQAAKTEHDYRPIALSQNSQ